MSKRCENCRYRVWYERPKKRNPCESCLLIGERYEWKRRRLWQIVRDFIERRRRKK